MKKLLFVFLVFLTLQSHSQSMTQIDSLATELCASLKGYTTLKDSTNIQMAFEKHVAPFAGKLKNLTSQQGLNDLVEKISIRLQLNCHAFQSYIMAASAESNKSDWQIVASKPASKVSKSAGRKFLSKKVYYKEADGSFVTVTLDGKFWMESFEDKTYSKCTFRWINDTEFEIAFLESNNKSRKNGIPGESYQYGIYQIEGDAASVWSTKGAAGAVYISKLYNKPE